MQSDIRPGEYSLAQPIKNLIKQAPVFVAPDATIASAAQQMQRARIGSILVTADPPGIVTDRDLRGRVLAANVSPEAPVVSVMTRPLKTVDAAAPAFSALRTMVEQNIHHLIVIEESQIIGVVSATDLLIYQTKSPLYLRNVIDRIGENSDLGEYAEQIASQVDALFRGGLGALEISQIVSGLNDALTQKLVELAERTLGPAPTPYAWIVFGSEGRSEQTLLTDQDNALVFAENAEHERTYFEALAKRVVDGLIRARFPACPGGFMAINWCKPLNEWQQLFRGWITLPKPDALLDASIFFDFRPVAGSLPLDALDNIISHAKKERRFLAHMLAGALAFRPALGLFNQLRTENGTIDLKRKGIAPIVGLARAAALTAGSRARSTVERLRIGGASGLIFDGTTAEDLTEVLRLLLRLRLRAQLAAWHERQPISHAVEVAQLSRIERRQLREGFVAVKQLQDNLRGVWQLDRLA